MRVKPLRILALLVASLPLLLPIAAQDASSAKAFLAAVYGHYGRNGKGIELTSRYVDSSLLKLIEADARAAGPDYVGAIDADPLCDCQDWDGIWDLRIDVELKAPQRAVARVSFALASAKSRTKDDWRKLRITLVQGRSGWRIYDVESQLDTKTPWRLRRALEEDIEVNRHTHRP